MERRTSLVLLLCLLVLAQPFAAMSTAKRLSRRSFRSSIQLGARLSEKQLGALKAAILAVRPADEDEECAAGYQIIEEAKADSLHDDLQREHTQEFITDCLKPHLEAFLSTTVELPAVKALENHIGKLLATGKKYSFEFDSLKQGVSALLASPQKAVKDTTLPLLLENLLNVQLTDSQLVSAESMTPLVSATALSSSVEGLTDIFANNNLSAEKLVVAFRSALHMFPARELGDASMVERYAGADEELRAGAVLVMGAAMTVTSVVDLISLALHHGDVAPAAENLIFVPFLLALATEAEEDGSALAELVVAFKAAHQAKGDDSAQEQEEEEQGSEEEDLEEEEQEELEEVPEVVPAKEVVPEVPKVPEQEQEQEEEEEEEPVPEEEQEEEK